MAALIGLSGSRAQADDWLVAWPECSQPDASRAELALLYPSPAVPAVVPAGQALVARVRTPAALTPPPGIHQERALRDFLGMLSAPAARVGVTADVQHRHTLPVVSVRADGASSLVYRVRLQLPAYLAEGTYTFTLRTPFGTREAVAAVRVVRSAPRFASLPAGVSSPPSAANAWPVDVWLADRAEPVPEAESPPDPAGERNAGLRLAAAATALLDAQLAPLAAAPVLARDGPALALRVGDELWVRRGCADARAFERELPRLAANEGLRRVELRVALQRAAPPPSAAELAAHGELARAASGAQLDNRTSSRASELSLLLPFASGARVSAGTLELYPASDPSPA
ncbi:MAG TPA: hypothetical protein VJR89_21725, partial [Polyangiales bacterium]|nr:hypothetical protein [Polyangiales bacterium]